jgi:hypothetical protein
MPLRTARTATTAATRYQYTWAMYILVGLNMPSLFMSIPWPIPPMSMPLISIVTVYGWRFGRIEIRMMDDIFL